jgi:hypothetical protein
MITDHPSHFYSPFTIYRLSFRRIDVLLISTKTPKYTMTCELTEKEPLVLSKVLKHIFININSL